ncbi:hypothetical protein YC2023_059333 [Brassica napus]
MNGKAVPDIWRSSADKYRDRVAVLDPFRMIIVFNFQLAFDPRPRGVIWVKSSLHVTHQRIYSLIAVKLLRGEYNENILNVHFIISSNKLVKQPDNKHTEPDHTCLHATPHLYGLKALSINPPLQPWLALSQSRSCCSDSDTSFPREIFVRPSTAAIAENAQQPPACAYNDYFIWCWLVRFRDGEIVLIKVWLMVRRIKLMYHIVDKIKNIEASSMWVHTPVSTKAKPWGHTLDLIHR